MDLTQEHHACRSRPCERSLSGGSRARHIAGTPERGEDPPCWQGQTRRAILRNLSEFPTTSTLLPAIVAAATAGLITPNAASGIAIAL